MDAKGDGYSQTKRSPTWRSTNHHSSQSELGLKITARRLGRAVRVSLAPAGWGLAESTARTPSPRPAVEPCSLDRRVPRTPVQSVQGTWRWKNPWGGDGGSSSGWGGPARLLWHWWGFRTQWVGATFPHKVRRHRHWKQVSEKICESLSPGHLRGDGLEVEEGGDGICLISEPSKAFEFDYHAYVSLLHSRKTKNFPLMTKIFLRMRRIWAEACHGQEWGGGAWNMGHILEIYWCLKWVKNDEILALISSLGYRLGVGASLHPSRWVPSDSPRIAGAASPSWHPSPANCLQCGTPSGDGGGPAWAKCTTASCRAPVPTLRASAITWPS